MRAPLALIAVAALALAGGVAAAPAKPPAARPVATIVIDKLAFGPAPKGLRVGQTLAWENRDILQHSATARDGGFDLVLKPRARGQVTLTRPGSIAVYCRYHPGMTLTIEVAK